MTPPMPLIPLRCVVTAAALALVSAACLLSLAGALCLLQHTLAQLAHLLWEEHPYA